MPQSIAIHWTKNYLRAVVVGRRVAHAEVDNVIEFPLEESDEPETIGKKLAEVLTPCKPGRSKIVFAVGRDMLSWQHLELPPCPAAELPDLVHMQTDVDVSSTDELVGFDFLPLSGDESTPNRVIAIAVEAEELAKLQTIWEAAEITPDRLVPLALGWPAAAQRAIDGDEQPIRIFITPFAQEATIWATVNGQITLFRRIQLPAADNFDTLEKIVAAELRRTLLAIAQQQPEIDGASIWIAGKRPDKLTELVELLDQKLDVDVLPMDFSADSAIVSAKLFQNPSAADTMPLVGLALDEAVGNAPPIDLLHPRKRVIRRSNRRLYALAGTAIFAAVAFFGGKAYTKLNAPVEAADIAREEMALLEKSKKELLADENFEKTVRTWMNDAPNILIELQHLSKIVRPVALNSEDFVIDQDVVIEKLEIGERQMVIDIAARKYPELQPLEDRLRSDGSRRVQRDGTAELEETIPGYPWHIRSTIDVAEDEPSKEGNKS